MNPPEPEHASSPTAGSTVAWFHCFSGVAGDMLLGALLDAGVDVGAVRSAVAQLPVDGWSLDVEVVQRGGLRATRAVVDAPADPHHHRTFADIRTLLRDADLAERVTTRALSVFAALAEVEGELHGMPAEDVHFHEVGSLDAIVDVVGTCAALELLHVDVIRTSPVRVGLGTVTAAHGELPNPAPATMALLVRSGISVEGVATTTELATPTGVALLAALTCGSGPLPAITPRHVGYGAGTRDVAGRANVVQVVVGAAAPGDEGAFGPGQPMVELAANVDDVTGEVLGHALAALLAGGADDAWVTPIVMKKGRPAHTLHALCDPAAVEVVGGIFVQESGTLGLRATSVSRWPQARREVVVDVDGHPIRLKQAGRRVKPEHDDAVRAAAALGRPLREILAQAERLGEQRGELGGGELEPTAEIDGDDQSDRR